jgi:hypothetical protein
MARVLRVSDGFLLLYESRLGTQAVYLSRDSEKRFLDGFDSPVQEREHFLKSSHDLGSLDRSLHEQGVTPYRLLDLLADFFLKAHRRLLRCEGRL